MLTATIPGKPVPAARPRVVNGHAFTPAEYAAWKRGAAFVLRAAGARCPCPPGVPLWAEVTVYHPRPQSKPAHVDAETWRSGMAVASVTRSDLDNHVKAVLDALQDSGWLDNDNRIAHLVASAYYAPARGAVGVDVSVGVLSELAP